MGQVPTFTKRFPAKPSEQTFKVCRETKIDANETPSLIGSFDELGFKTKILAIRSRK